MKKEGIQTRKRKSKTSSGSSPTSTANNNNLTLNNKSAKLNGQPPNKKSKQNSMTSIMQANNVLPTITTSSIAYGTNDYQDTLTLSTNYLNSIQNSSNHQLSTYAQSHQYAAYNQQLTPKFNYNNRSYQLTVHQPYNTHHYSELININDYTNANSLMMQKLTNSDAELNKQELKEVIFSGNFDGITETKKENINSFLELNTTAGIGNETIIKIKDEQKAIEDASLQQQQPKQEIADELNENQEQQQQHIKDQN